MRDVGVIFDGVAWWRWMSDAWYLGLARYLLTYIRRDSCMAITCTNQDSLPMLTMWRIFSANHGHGAGIYLIDVNP